MKLMIRSLILVCFILMGNIFLACQGTSQTGVRRTQFETPRIARKVVRGGRGGGGRGVAPSRGTMIQSAGKAASSSSYVSSYSSRGKPSLTNSSSKSTYYLGNTSYETGSSNLSSLTLSITKPNYYEEILKRGKALLSSVTKYTDNIDRKLHNYFGGGSTSTNMTAISSYRGESYRKPPPYTIVQNIFQPPTTRLIQYVLSGYFEPVIS